MIKNKDENNLIVALDVGTSKIVVIVAELLPDGVLKIIGLGQHVSKGLKKGVVVNIESTMQAIQRAVEEAELKSEIDYVDMRYRDGFSVRKTKKKNKDKTLNNTI